MMTAERLTECDLPEMPYDAWTETRHTLHGMMQVVGKLRMSLSPPQNHWWHITLYPTESGFSTGPMPFRSAPSGCAPHGDESYGSASFESTPDSLSDGDRSFESQTMTVTFNCICHRLEIATSAGESELIQLKSGLSVASFYSLFRKELAVLGVPREVLEQTYDQDDDPSFEEMTDLSIYDDVYVERFWRIMLWVHNVFSEFRGRSFAKTSPVHLFWHHLDLAMTRFSGRRNPPMPRDTPAIKREDYPHEEISFGFWAGDETIQAPAFYSYTYPSPDGVNAEPLQPDAAKWIDSNGSPMALLYYDDLRTCMNPRDSLLAFLESAYEAGGRLADWDLDDLRARP